MKYWIGWAIISMIVFGAEVSADSLGTKNTASYFGDTCKVTLPVTTQIQNSCDEEVFSFFKIPQNATPNNFSDLFRYYRPEYRSKLTSPLLIDGEHEIRNEIFPFHGFL